MQPEEIIQAKEWQQLSEAERELLMPLASKKGEYNILKKMLLIAQEDAYNVPAVSPLLQKQLHHQLPKPLQNRKMFWYAAAAAILVLLFAAFFVLQPKKTNEIAKKATQIPAKEKSIDTTKHQTLPLPNMQEEIVKQQQTKSMKQQRVLKIDTTRKPDVGYNYSPNNATQLNPQKDVARNDISTEEKGMNTSVGQNTDLLSFVTEVY